uniref:Uncharacterized protein n=1 Tax=Octopus bimaculoides TaxID=37653 RepID=A0A0L8G9C6_OCTBM
MNRGLLSLLKSKVFMTRSTKPNQSAFVKILQSCATESIIAQNPGSRSTNIMFKIVKKSLRGQD